MHANILVISKASREFWRWHSVDIRHKTGMQLYSLLMIAGDGSALEKGAASWLATPKEAGKAAVLKAS